MLRAALWKDLGMWMTQRNKFNLLTKSQIQRRLISSQFEESKERTLLSLRTSRNDRSMKGTVDEEIRELLDEINKKPQFYTTSSCSGRVQILGMTMGHSDQMRPFWMFQSHSGIESRIFSELFHQLGPHPTKGSESVFGGIDEDTKLEHPIVEGELTVPNFGQLLSEIRLVCQGPILHIATESVDIAKQLLNRLQTSGIKQSMIRSITPNRTILSCTSSTNISALLWINEFGWLVDFSKNELPDVLARRVSKTMHESRSQYKARIRDGLKEF